MAQNADQVYKTQAEIVAEVIAAWQARVPDMNLAPDSITRIWTEVFANTGEGLMLMGQLLHDDMFIATQSALALMRSGEQYGRTQKLGTPSVGAVRFEGSGGTLIPLGTSVAAPRPSLEDALIFSTTAVATIPNPGLATAPTAVDGGSGALTGTYEYAVTFVTDGGETTLGDISDPIIFASDKVTLSDIAIGGPGTTARKVYARLNGGVWGLLTTIADNVTTGFGPSDAALTTAPPSESTAERITVAAQSSDVGKDYNVGVGTITDLQSVEPGLSGVINLVAFAGGSDIEDIETFRTELLKRVRNPQSGSLEDLESWATDIDGVVSATGFKNVDLAGGAALGTVSIRIVGPDGSIPDGDHVDAVQAYLESKDLANITILVGTFTADDQDVTVAIDLSTGYVLADVTPSVQQAIKDYINSVPVGGTVYKSGILSAVFGLPGVDTLTTTFTDTTVAATAKPVPGVITVT